MRSSNRRRLPDDDEEYIGYDPRKSIVSSTQIDEGQDSGDDEFDRRRREIVAEESMEMIAEGREDSTSTGLLGRAGGASDRQRARVGASGSMFSKFQSFWNTHRPENWSGESDPHTIWSHLINLVTLVVVAAIVLTLPILLNILAPQAPIAPGVSTDPGVDIVVASGTVAAVAADHPECSSFGLQMITTNSGSAADAAVAATLCQTVLHPFSAGLGGSGLVLFYTNKGNNATVYDGLSTVPRHAKSPFARGPEDASSAAVPGLLKSLEALHKQHGQVPWKSIFSAVAAMAGEWAVSRELATVLVDNEELVLSHPHLRQLFTKTVESDAILNSIDGTAQPSGSRSNVVVLKEGDTVKQVQLQKTLASIGSRGSDAFYRQLASGLSSDLKENKGAIEESDLKSYKGKESEPLSLYFAGYKIFTARPPSAGVVVAKALAILEGFRLRRRGRNGEAYHFVIEAIKLALADFSTLRDPAFDDSMQDTVRQMLDKDAAQHLRAHIQQQPAVQTSSTRQEVARKEDKEDGSEVPSVGTHVAATDDKGNTVSVTASLGSLFGCGVVSTSTGVLMNDELFRASDLNVELTAGMRPINNMAPAVVVDFEQMQYAVGSGGSADATQAMILTLMNAVEYGDDVGAAIAAPRLEYDPKSDQVRLEAINVEECAINNAFRRTNGAPFAYWDEVCSTLKSKGHTVMGAKELGRVQGLSMAEEREEDDGTDGESTGVRNMFFALSDPRNLDSAAAAE